MLKWESTWDPSLAAVVNPGQRPGSSPPSSAVRVSQGCVDNLTPLALVRSWSGLGLPELLLPDFLEIRVWSLGQQCVWSGGMWWMSSPRVIWSRNPLMSHGECWSSLSCLCYTVVIYMIGLGHSPWGGCSKRKWHTWQVIWPLACSIISVLCGILWKCNLMQSHFQMFPLFSQAIARINFMLQ